MKKRMIAAIAATIALMMGCTDDLFIVESQQHGGDDGKDGLAFHMATTEQADMIVSLGQTRASQGDTARKATPRPTITPLKGSPIDGLSIRRMQLPVVGIHKRAVAAPTEATTRAAISAIAKNEQSFHDSITVWGYTLNPYKDTGASKAEKSTIFNQVLLTKIRNWRSSAHWPYGGGTMKFYAVAPSLEGINMSVKGTAPDFYTPPTLVYTLPEDAREMVDLLYGESQVIDIEGFGTKEEHLGADDKFVDLTFSHILTCVRFAKGTMPEGITINRITISGICTKGTYNPYTDDPYTGTRGRWTNTSGTETYTIYPGGKTSTDGTGTNVYIDGDSCFFMLPHLLGTNARLEVQLTEKLQYQVDDNGRYLRDADGKPKAIDADYKGKTTKQHTIACSLSGDIWRKGYTMTYKLTVGELEDGYYLIAEQPEAHEHSSSPTEGSFTVHSYHNFIDYSNDGTPSETEALKNSHPVKWKVTGYSLVDPESEDFVDWKSDNPTYIPGQTVNKWLSINGGSGGYNTNASYTIAPQEPVKCGKHSDIFIVNNKKDDINEINLAKSSPNNESYSTPQLANCYIINRGGGYVIPLTYGNWDTTNGSAIFKDHTGATITDPNILDQMKEKTPTGDIDIEVDSENELVGYREEYYLSDAANLQAVVIWQDHPGQFKAGNVKTSDNTLGFTVRKDMNNAANAVIALQGRKVYRKYERTKNNDTYTWKAMGDWKNPQEWETFWTWHIWMTDEIWPNDGFNNTYKLSYDETFLNYDKVNKNHLVAIQNKDGVSNTIMPVPLGWVPDDDEYKYYAPREVWVKLKQDPVEKDEGKAQETYVKIMQHARQPLITGTCTVYEWGRPTALPMVRHINKTVHHIYGDSGDNPITSDFKIVRLDKDYWNFISYPLAMFQYIKYSSNDDDKSWFDKSNTGYSFWGSSGSETYSKTAYDPCPAGFQLPTADVFTGLSRSGSNSQSGKFLNMWEDAGDKEKGGYFYQEAHITEKTDPPALTEAVRYGGTFYVPATGRWSGAADDEKEVIVDRDKKYTDTSSGIFWLAGRNNEGGNALWVHPEYKYSESSDPKSSLSKPAIGFDANTVQNFNTAIPIIPTGSLPAVTPKN